MGRLHHRRRREHRICADAGGDRLLHRHLSHGDLRHACRVPARLLAARLHHLRRSQHARRRAVVHDHRHDDPACDRRARHLLRRRHSVLRLRQKRAEHRRRSGDRSGSRAARGQRSVPAVRGLRHLRRHALCRVAVSCHRATSARGGRIDRPEARHAEGHHVRHVYADRAWRSSSSSSTRRSRSRAR